MLSRCCKDRVDVLIDYYVCAVCLRPTNPIFSKDENKEYEGHDVGTYDCEIETVFD